MGHVCFGSSHNSVLLSSPRTGIEPGTSSTRGKCLTTELPRFHASFSCKIANTDMFKMSGNLDVYFSFSNYP